MLEVRIGKWPWEVELGEIEVKVVVGNRSGKCKYNKVEVRGGKESKKWRWKRRWEVEIRSVTYEHL
jgi:hypothetical protein